MQRVTFGQSSDCLDSLLISLDDGDYTGQHTFAIHQDCARTTTALATAVLGSDKIRFLPESIEKRAIRICSYGLFIPLTVRVTVTSIM